MNAEEATLEMYRRAVVAATIAAAMLGMSCGGPASPTSATPATTTSVSAATIAMPVFRDGWTEAPVTDAGASPPSPPMDSAVHVEASGYLPRDTVFADSALYLWPGDPSYVQALVYYPEVNGKLTRWTDAGFTIGLGPLAQDAEVLAVVDQAIGEAERASGLTITTAITGAVSLGIVPDDPAFTRSPGAVGVTYLTLMGSRIVSALVLFRTRTDMIGTAPASFTNTVLHELGHVQGLGHSPRLDDVMDPGNRGRTEARAYSERERVQLKMMYRWRRPGNTAPDRDPGANSTADRTRRVIGIVD